MTDQIVSVKWVDNHQTAAAFHTSSGKQYVLPRRFLPKGLVATPAYSVLTARYANAEHTAIVADTPEAGHVAVSAADTPAFWEHIHKSGVKIEPYQTVKKEEPIPQTAEGTEILSVSIPQEEQQPSWLGSLLTRADAAPAEEQQQPLQLDPDAFLAQFSGEQEAQQQQFVQAINDSDRKRAARAQVADAVFKAAQRVMAGQVRFEVALEAKNGRVDSIAMLEEEAATKGITVALLAEQIVVERRARERRMMHVHSIEARALTEIDAASGDTIDAIAAAATAKILGDE